MIPKNKLNGQARRALLLFVLLFGLVVYRSLTGLSPTSAHASSSQQQVPNFDHIVIITFENKGYEKIIDNPLMPAYNMYALGNTLLTGYHAVAHPSLPNYIAMIGGDTFGITDTCEDCFVNSPSLPDLIEASGRTWKAYQEDMETPCQLGDHGEHGYVQHHDPFVYFDSIRLNKERCEKSVVPLDRLDADIQAGNLANFIFITPNMCHNSHDCNLIVSDGWLTGLLMKLIPALEKQSSNYLVVLNWDEGDTHGSCCSLPSDAGGRIPVVLISPRARDGFQDPTPYTHYSLLKTISKAWGLPYLGHAADGDQRLILAPWK